MAPISRLKPKKTFEKRVKNVWHVRGKQKKLTDFFPPSPKPNRNKSHSEKTSVSSENQSPPPNTSPHRYSLRPKKSEPRKFFGYDCESDSTISPTKRKIVKVLFDNSSNIKAQLKKDSDNVDKISTLLKESKLNTSNVENRLSPLLPAGDLDLYKPQRNARRVYLKYGTRVPSFNDIIKSRNELIKFKEDVASIAELQKHPPLQCDKSGFPEANDADTLERLNCKHLSEEALKLLFEEYTDFVIGTASGATPSERHRLYMKDPFGGSLFHRGELTFNISMTAFTSKQKVLLARLAKKALRGKFAYNNQYYFKVVLPDLCFKIFMQEHNLTEKQATDYLANPLL